MGVTKLDFSDCILDLKISIGHLELVVKRLEKFESQIDFEEVPENDGSEKRDSWPHA